MYCPISFRSLVPFRSLKYTATWSVTYYQCDLHLLRFLITPVLFEGPKWPRTEVDAHRQCDAKPSVTFPSKEQCNCRFLFSFLFLPKVGVWVSLGGWLYAKTVYLLRWQFPLDSSPWANQS